MLQKIKNLFFHLPKSIFYQAYYHFPAKKLTLIGITGTDGKTTTATLIYETLKKAGINAGVITTISAKYDDHEIDTGLHMTSPDPAVIQKIFKTMADAGVTHVVCEVTAHALDQYRFHGCQFAVSAITNTSHEHLDYFKNMDEYIHTKAKIFNQSQINILNKDDPSYERILKKIPQKFLSYSINKKSDYQAINVVIKTNSISFDVNKTSLISDSPYRYQTYNILTAFSVIDQLKIDKQFLVETIKNFPLTKGRREEVPNNLNIKTIVDFAHTPNAIKNTLESLKETTNGRIIAIFGATGGRDQSKRPQMGLVVSQLANIAIITSDDTRDEKVEDINKQIINGLKPDSVFIESNDISQIKKNIKSNKNKFIYFNIPNRQDAFNLAIKISQPKDTIISMGKGHENTILLGKTEYPWSETEAFRSAFKLKENKNAQI
ncbi:MAG: UDP-N-acetylmuramoyl-L-alanyl-D-glutamate--2,6-diaminopimelate ligase [Candidatus Shapirobacteria bacterium]|nr:UDP-N-acetylmuramoyl-L-alanyl-D-glutamate--2,6-diaminopimelate ligase [Candidatus Shapirobacteria bacterium]